MNFMSNICVKYFLFQIIFVSSASLCQIIFMSNKIFIKGKSCKIKYIMSNDFFCQMTLTAD